MQSSTEEDTYARLLERKCLTFQTGVGGSNDLSFGGLEFNVFRLRPLQMKRFLTVTCDMAQTGGKI